MASALRRRLTDKGSGARQWLPMPWQGKRAMLLTSQSIAYYLFEHNLVTTESTVDGDLRIFESASRNRNFRIVRRGHPSYFVKQTLQWEPQQTAFLQREAACYWLATHDA